jgi:1,4-alpha-glucan branching enzyme
VRAATAVLLLAPGLPLLFMGQEWGAVEPFLFFSDLGPDLAAAVREGRRREFARFAAFRDPAARAAIPDPQEAGTRDRSVLRWERLAEPAAAAWLAFHRDLLALREREVAPLLADGAAPAARWRRLGTRALAAEWRWPGGDGLRLAANLGPAAAAAPGPGPGAGRCVLALGVDGRGWDALPAWSVAVHRVEPGAAGGPAAPR